MSGFPQWGTVAVGDALPYVPEHQGGGEVVLEQTEKGNQLRLKAGASNVLRQSCQTTFRPVEGGHPVILSPGSDTDTRSHLPVALRETGRVRFPEDGHTEVTYAESRERPGADDSVPRDRGGHVSLAKTGDRPHGDTKNGASRPNRPTRHGSGDR